MRQKVKNSESNESINPIERELIEVLLNYPSLEEVFDPADERRFQTMRQKMQATVDDLERVVRRGTKEDAAKAAKVVEAFQITLKFLADLDSRRRI